MPDPYDGVTIPDPERVRLCQAWYRPSPLEEVAEGVSVASLNESIRQIYIERVGNTLWRWHLSHAGGPYPLMRITARYLKVDYHYIAVPFSLVDDKFHGTRAPDESIEADASAVLTFRTPATPAEVSARILAEVGSD